MLHLMKLEIRKIKFGSYIRNCIFMNLCIVALVTAMGFASVYSKDNENLLKNYREMLIMADVIVRGAFLIFSSVLLNRLTVSEYKERTVLQLFTYPIARKRIFAAKLAIVFLFTSIGALIFSVVDNAFFLGVSRIGNLFTDATVTTFADSLMNCLLGAVMCGFISLIPFYFGMRNKSQAATIVSSFVITVILSNSFGSIVSSSYMLRLFIIGGVSVLVAIYTVCVKLNQLEDIDL